jgi:hypothetical protein
VTLREFRNRELLAVCGRAFRAAPQTYMEFEGGTPLTVYRNWDIAPNNYGLGGDVTARRRGELLR